MRESKLEKIKINPIQAFIENEIEKSKDDPNPSPLRMIKVKELISEAEELFSLIEKKEFEAAHAKVDEVKEKIEKMKDSEKKNSNESFVRFFDDKIAKALENKQTNEFNQQDNT